MSKQETRGWESWVRDGSVWGYSNLDGGGSSSRPWARLGHQFGTWTPADPQQTQRSPMLPAHCRDGVYLAYMTAGPQQLTWKLGGDHNKVICVTGVFAAAARVT